jgi:hypothetical protein
MVACVHAVAAAALAMVSVSFAAVAQVVPPGAQIVPPSDQPGRERERFERPPVPLAQPGGPAISVPGIEAPPGAAETKLVIRQIRIVGATVYTLKASRGSCGHRSSRYGSTARTACPAGDRLP